MTLQQLRYVTTVAETGTISGAAKALFISQPSLTASIREHFALHPADFDPRQYLKPARQAIKELVAHKIVDVLGCDGKAF